MMVQLIVPHRVLSRDVYARTLGTDVALVLPNTLVAAKMNRSNGVSFPTHYLLQNSLLHYVALLQPETLVAAKMGRITRVSFSHALLAATDNVSFSFPTLGYNLLSKIDMSPNVSPPPEMTLDVSRLSQRRYQKSVVPEERPFLYYSRSHKLA